MGNPSEAEPEWHRLVISYQPLVFSFAPRYTHLMEWDELVSAGNLGLIRYAKRYVEVRPEYAFATGAKLYIRSSMVDAIRERYGRNGLKPKTININASDMDEDEGFLCTSPVAADDVEGDTVRGFLKRSLRLAISSLSEEQKCIVEGYYFCGRTLSSIAAELGLPDSRIRLLHREAISRLRGILETAGYSSFPWEISEHGTDGPTLKAVRQGRWLATAD